MQVTVWGIEFLGWNARWVTGYAGSNDLLLALDRGEVDMTATSNNVQLSKLVATGRFRILNQAGTLEHGKFVGRPDLKDVPVFIDQIEGKITDPLAEKAFKYWVSITATDKFLSLAPKTPAPIVAAYRDAFWKIMKDPEFVEHSSKLSDELTPMSHTDMELLINTLADTPPEVVSYLTTLLGKQGLKASE
jgi:tripartite-type tricarboxylate transporter receptor subunit TctC